MRLINIQNQILINVDEIACIIIERVPRTGSDDVDRALLVFSLTNRDCVRSLPFDVKVVEDLLDKLSFFLRRDSGNIFKIEKEQ